MQFTVDTSIGMVAKSFRLPLDEQNRQRFELIRDNFIFHVKNNAFYRAQCESEGVSVYDIETFEDLVKIPLIPMQTFKDPNSHVLLSTKLTAIELELKSTGTSGIPSVTRRDARSVDRAVLGIMALYREHFAFSRGAGLFLCPSLAESPEMGMVKALNLFCGLLSDTRYLVRDYAFYPEDAISYLESFEGKETRYIFGPPFLVSRLVSHMAEEGIHLQLDPDSLIVMIGGWKRFTGEFISRQEMLEKIEKHLGVPANRVRDMYGFVESNMLAIECEHHNKHMPPWCHLTIRDINDQTKEVAPGEEGVIGVMDASMESYPCFLLTEDVGAKVAESCPCGRVGPVVEFYRRLEGREFGCCAVSLERFIATTEIEKSCSTSAAE